MFGYPDETLFLVFDILLKESVRGNRGYQALQCNGGRGDESQQRATSVVCTLYRQEQRWEDFIAFIHLPRITGEVIAETIVSILHGLSLEIENIRSQG